MSVNISLSVLQIIGLVLPVTIVAGRFLIDQLEERAGEFDKEPKQFDVFQYILLIVSLLVAGAMLSIIEILEKVGMFSPIGLSLISVGTALFVFVPLLVKVRDEFELQVEVY